ncbi:hypothetical protein DFH07DRAFT_961474 [Mycena maculata]|uniref:Infection structure specific protein n=1 Tax=Mycena maculata TaxID=230809 RepID=A0AAD7N846_9AGAR|nr:hypothetical protein DFH07DRAFT_961474 [Mycena maculata]
MKLILFAVFTALAFGLKESHAINIPRQNETLTTSIPGLFPPSPTQTASAIVSAYQQAVQLCGPDVDAQQQAAIQAYNEAVPVAQNATSFDSAVQQWASENYAPLQGANSACQLAENQLDAAEDSVDTTSNVADPTSSTTSGAAAPQSTAPGASSTGSSAGTSTKSSTAPSTSSSSDGVLNAPPMMVILTGLIGLLAGLT